MKLHVAMSMKLFPTIRVIFACGSKALEAIRGAQVQVPTVTFYHPAFFSYRPFFRPYFKNGLTVYREPFNEPTAKEFNDSRRFSTLPLKDRTDLLRILVHGYLCCLSAGMIDHVRRRVLNRAYTKMLSRPTSILLQVV